MSWREQGRGLPLVHSSGWSQAAAPAEEAVPADGDGSVVCWGAPAGAGDSSSSKIASDHDLLLDHGLAAEHDVLGADQGSFASYLVAGVLDGSSELGETALEMGK